LFIEWAIIGVVVAVISLTMTDNAKAGNLVAILFAGVIYVAFGAVLAKFGYARKSLTQMRAEAAAAPPRAAGKGSGTPAPGAKPKPAPTSRTSTGPSNRPQKKRR
jgi:hypothetical protein